MGAIMKKPATNVMTFDICKQRKRDFLPKRKMHFDWIFFHSCFMRSIVLNIGGLMEAIVLRPPAGQQRRHREAVKHQCPSLTRVPECIGDMWSTHIFGKYIH